MPSRAQVYIPGEFPVRPLSIEAALQADVLPIGARVKGIDSRETMQAIFIAQARRMLLQYDEALTETELQTATRRLMVPHLNEQRPFSPHLTNQEVADSFLQTLVPYTPNFDWTERHKRFEEESGIRVRMSFGLARTLVDKDHRLVVGIRWLRTNIWLSPDYQAPLEDEKALRALKDSPRYELLHSEEQLQEKLQSRRRSKWQTAHLIGRLATSGEETDR